MEMEIKQLMKLVLKEAENRRDEAGYSGRHDDGGASLLEDQVKFYKMGMAGTIPGTWENLEIVKTIDPEWNEFQRLKKKFNH